MVEGTLAYYRNGEYWGIAYKDNELKKGELVAAVAPIYNNDIFSLRAMLKEDWIILILYLNLKFN